MKKAHIKYYLIALLPWLYLIVTAHNVGIFWGTKRWLFFFMQVLLPTLYVFPFASVAWRFSKKWDYPAFFSMALGISVLGIVNYLEGRIFLINNAVQWSMWTICLIVEGLGRFQFTKYLFEAIKNFLTVDSLKSCLNHLITAITVAFFLLTWALPPPLGAAYPPIIFDLSLLHLTIPQTYLYNEGIVNPWWLRATFIPQFPHLLFTGGMSWASIFTTRIDLFPIFLSGTFFLVCLTGFIEFFKNKPRIGLAAFLMFLCFPIARWHLTTAYLDALLIVEILATFLAAAAFLNTGKDRYFYLVAFFSAMSFSTKHFGAFYAAPMALFCLFDLIRREKYLRPALLFSALGIALVPLVVFFHYNVILTGSPFFPFTFSENNDLLWDLESLQKFNKAINHFRGGISFIDWLQLPWTISTSDKHSDIPDFTVGRLWIALWCFILVVFLYRRFKKRPYDPTEILLFITINLQTAIWYLASPVYRYLTCELMLMSLFGVYITRTLEKKWAIALSFIFLFYYSFGNIGMISTRPVAPFARTPEQVQEYIAEIIPSYSALKQLQQMTASQKDVLVYSLIDEGNWLYYPLPHIGDWFTTSSYFKLETQDTEKLKQFFSSRKVTHILYNGERETLVTFNFPKNLGEYSSCLSEIIQARNHEKIKIFEINKTDSRCYDNSLPMDKSIEYLLKTYPYFENIPFEPRKKNKK